MTGFDRLVFHYSRNAELGGGDTRDDGGADVRSLHSCHAERGGGDTRNDTIVDITRFLSGCFLPLLG
jgi:hypothetical protein